jgi:DNA-binding MarR family transcriptional regulator
MLCDNIWRDVPQSRDFSRKEYDDRQIRAALAWLAGRTVEHMVIAYYTEDSYLITVEELAKGRRHSVDFEPDDIFRRCIMLSARGFIAIHNHPFDTSAPSRQDISMMQRLISLGSVLKIHLLDALIVDAQGNCTSLRQTKAIDPWYPDRPWAHHGPAIAKALLSIEQNVAAQPDEIRPLIEGPALRLLMALYLGHAPKLVQELSHETRLSQATAARALKSLLTADLIKTASPTNSPRSQRYQLTGRAFDIIESVLTGERVQRQLPIPA